MTDPQQAPIARVGGRALLLDPDDRVLLIHETIEGSGEHWLTPGGGVEPGEHPRDAAVREALEETGIAIRLSPNAEPVLTTQRYWSWRDLHFDQVDHFFLARVPAVQPRPLHLTDVERQTLLGLRWWSVPELLSTREVLLPPDLGSVVRRLIAAGA